MTKAEKQLLQEAIDKGLTLGELFDVITDILSIRELSSKVDVYEAQGMKDDAYQAKRHLIDFIIGAAIAYNQFQFNQKFADLITINQ